MSCIRGEVSRSINISSVFLVSRQIEKLSQTIPVQTDHSLSAVGVRTMLMPWDEFIEPQIDYQ